MTVSYIVLNKHTVIYSYNNEKFILRRKGRSKLKGVGHRPSAKRMTSILRHVAEAYPTARQGTILNSHRVIGVATTTSMVLNCALKTYIMMTADVGPRTYPGHIVL